MNPIGVSIVAMLIAMSPGNLGLRDTRVSIVSGEGGRGRGGGRGEKRRGEERRGEGRRGRKTSICMSKARSTLSRAHSWYRGRVETLDANI